MFLGNPNIAERPVATSTDRRIIVSVRRLHRSGPASAPMSSTSSRPLAAQAGPGIGEGLGLAVGSGLLGPPLPGVRLGSMRSVGSGSTGGITSLPDPGLVPPAPDPRPSGSNTLT